MWTRRISSGTAEYSTPQSVFRALVNRLIDERVDSAWARFEVVARQGWLTNLLFLKEPWVEVALLDDRLMELITDPRKSTHSIVPAVPEMWLRGKRKSWIVPVSDRDELMTWLHAHLTSLSGNRDYCVSGWLNGL